MRTAKFVIKMLLILNHFVIEIDSRRVKRVTKRDELAHGASRIIFPTPGVIVSVALNRKTLHQLDFKVVSPWFTRGFT